MVVAVACLTVSFCDDQAVDDVDHAITSVLIGFGDGDATHHYNVAVNHNIELQPRDSRNAFATDQVCSSDALVDHVIAQRFLQAFGLGQ